MTEGTEIFQQYADHLAKKAASVVVSLAVVGTVGGALLAAVPGLLGHSVVSPGANYFLVLLGAIAGAIMGRSFGEKRAVGIRFQAQMALHQAKIEQQGAVALRPAAAAAPAPAAAAAPAPAAAAAPAPAPAAVPVPPPAVPLVPIVPLVAAVPALVPVSPVVAAPTPKPLEPAPLSVPPLFAPAPPAAPAAAPALAPPTSPPAPAGPRLVEPLPLPPAPLLLPPLSAQR